jgi:transposase
LIDQHTAAIEQLTDRIEVVIEPFRSFRDLICSIPGIGGYTADIVVAETGADMTKFPTAQHLASWAGTTPGNSESAGKIKSRRTRPGNPYLQGALDTAAMSISQALPGSQVPPDRHPPGPAQSQRRRPTHCSSRSGTSPRPTPHTTIPVGTTSPASTPRKHENNAVRQLEALGYHVTLDRAS